MARARADFAYEFAAFEGDYGAVVRAALAVYSEELTKAAESQDAIELGLGKACREAAAKAGKALDAWDTLTESPALD